MSPSLRLSTSLARHYPWATAPMIVSAPMRIMSGPALAVAVSQAGGLGFIGPNVTTEATARDLLDASALVDQARNASAFQALHPSDQRLPIGVGFQLWSDDVDVAVAAVEKYRPCAAWLFAPRAGQLDLDLHRWSARLRERAPDTQIWIQIGTLAEAKAIVQSAPSHRPDVLVVQGAEAGGHGRAHDGLGLISLFPEVADAVGSAQAAEGKETETENEIALVAAGGIVDERGALAALGLGASGIAMGTRFLAATEARIARGYQEEVVRADDGAVSTTRTLLYNHLRGTFGWPPEYSPRTIINRSFREHQAGRPFEELKELHDEALKKGDDGWGPDGRLATYAGASIGLVREVREAKDIVGGVQEGVRRRLGGLVG